MNRRELLRRGGMGMGALMLPELLGAGPGSPLAVRSPHFAPRARRVIHIFANGGPSHVDTFDPKPALRKYEGQKPTAEGAANANNKGAACYPSPFAFRSYGKSGIPISDLFQHLGQCADDLCVIRSMKADNPNHEPSLLLMNCGEPRLSRPSMGAWLTYGLGSENQNLPGFIAMCPGGYPIYQSQNWQSAFLPGAYQGTYVDTQHAEVEKLVEHVRNGTLPAPLQRRQLDLLARLNREHQKERAEDAALEARIQSFELAYRMQADATDAFDVSREPKHILDLYGPGVQARQYLMARRLLERGVRFVQIWAGKEQPWDNHQNINQEIRRLAGESDRPLAALLKDLKQRGMLADTLVIWGGEFGRTPTAETRQDASKPGRDHQASGFTVWLAGGGVRGGTVHGATDEFGLQSVEKVVHVHDLHATILFLMGFDHTKLTYRYAGRDFRLTDVYGRVVTDILA
jgi:hypothetical protein